MGKNNYDSVFLALSVKMTSGPKAIWYDLIFVTWCIILHMFVLVTGYLHLCWLSVISNQFVQFSLTSDSSKGF